MKIVDKLLNENIEKILTYKLGATFTLNEVIRKSFKAGYQAAIDQIRIYPYPDRYLNDDVQFLEREIEDE